MKFSAATVLAMAAVVSAQSAADIPDCARPCLEKAVKDKTSCATTDYACICKTENFSAIRGAATSCVLEKCGTETAIGEVLPATQKLCAGAGDDEPDSSAPASAPATTDAAAPSTAAPSVSATPCETQSSEPAVTDCAPTAPANGTAPGPSAPVIAGAAGLAPVGGLAMVAVVALAL
ncbi:hypothetical protein C2857_003800 [Epichloe festucae Fl1]|uniref:CFEM domain-containing protein n=1 Tax=Epichloe festucae (strain Fl1) TaxID=877507 RepID=A0A7S9PS38_EPIFF|nr:hypothetical protein C2857_003800 [Epichloe festucae Fl1]